jgi:hypothetical protein
MAELEDDGEGTGEGNGVVEEWGIPRFFNLSLDPSKEHAFTYVGENFWVPYPAGNILEDHLTSLHKYRPMRPGTPAPYTHRSPNRRRSTQRRMRQMACTSGLAGEGD